MKCSSFLYGGMIKKFIISRFFMIIYFADIINSLPFYVFIALIKGAASDLKRDDLKELTSVFGIRTGISH
jgi:hypothetical protein